MTFQEMEGRRKAAAALHTAETEIAQLRSDSEAREAALTTARMARAAAEDSLKEEQEARKRDMELQLKLNDERAAEAIAE